MRSNAKKLLVLVNFFLVFGYLNIENLAETKKNQL